MPFGNFNDRYNQSFLCQILHKYPYMWCIHFMQGNLDCIWSTTCITTTLTSLSQNTTCRDIYVGVTCGHNVVLENITSLPCPHTSFFLSFNQSSIHFQKKKYNVLDVLNLIGRQSCIMHAHLVYNKYIKIANRLASYIALSTCDFISFYTVLSSTI